MEMILARVLFALLSAFSYPLQTFPCRQSLEHLLPMSPSSKKTHSQSLHTIMTIGILVGTFLVAFRVESLVLISGVIGTFAGLPICYIVPFLFYYKLSEGRGWTWKRIAAAVMAAFGVVAIFVNSISLGFTLREHLTTP